MQKIIIFLLCSVLICNAEVSVSEQCLADVQQLIPLVEEVEGDLIQGNWNVVIQAISTNAGLIEQTVKDCLETEVSITAGCTTALEALVPDVKNIYDDYKSANYVKLAQDAIGAAAQIEEAVKACGLEMEESEVSVSVTCIQDLEVLLPDLQKLVQDAEKGDYWALTKVVLESLTPLTNAYRNCVGELSAEDECHFMAGVLSSHVGQISDLISGQEWSTLDFTMKQQYGLISTVKAECKNQAEISTPSDECKDQVISLIPELYEIGLYAVKGDDTNVQSSATKYASDIKKVAETCKNKVELKVSEEEILGACRISLNRLSKYVILISEDTAAKNWSKLVGDLIAAAPRIAVSKSKCSSLELNTCEREVKGILTTLDELAKLALANDYNGVQTTALADYDRIKPVSEACGGSLEFVDLAEELSEVSEPGFVLRLLPDF